MKNKKMLLRLGLFAMVIGCLSMSTTSATKFKLNTDKIEALTVEYITNNIIPIHFADNGNDFGGFFYFSNGIGEDEGKEGETPLEQEYYGISITDGDGYAEYECDRQVKGFYYNAERGERLRPLDKETWATGLQEKIITSGGLFTVCSKSGYAAELKKCKEEDDKNIKDCEAKASSDFSVPGYGYYGQVTHSYSGQTMVLTVGINYDTGSAKSKFVTITGGFSPSFVRVGNNKYPVGFIYDQNGGVGFVGCQIATPNTGVVSLLNNYYRLINENDINPLSTLFYETGDKIDYKNNPDKYEPVNLYCSDAVRDSLLGVVIEGIVGIGQTGSLANSQYIGNPKNGNMQFFTSADISSNTIVNYARKKTELLCRGKWPQNGCTSVANNIQCCKGDKTIAAPDDNTYIVKNGNVTIYPFDSYTNQKRYDIFIDSGNLVINETDDKFVFNKNGFPTSDDDDGFQNEVNSRQGGYDDNVAIGSFIRGNFIVNGRIKSANDSGLENRYFIHGKISTRDSFETLNETFKWRCKNGNATNGDVCPQTKGDWVNPYQAAYLVVIDQNYDSILLKK